MERGVWSGAQMWRGALAPSERFGFRAPPVADAARRQAAAVRERETAKPKRERRAARGQTYALMPLIKNHL